MSEELTNRTMDDAAEYIKSQAPLQNVYESSDFVQGMSRGRLLEQERIIKLLESKSKCKLPEHDYNGNCYCDTIALIRGYTE